MQNLGQTPRSDADSKFSDPHSAHVRPVVLEGQFYNIPGQNWLQAIFGIIGKVILCRIIVQVAPLIPAWSIKL